MNCKQAKTHVALLIGNDLEPAALADVRNHLGQCVSCRQHFEKLSSCLEVLQAPPRGYSPEEESLWPKLSVRVGFADNRSKTASAERLGSLVGRRGGMHRDVLDRLEALEPDRLG